MRRVKGTQSLDAIDRRLADLLVADARVSNRSIAREVGLTDETVAGRIRRLRDEGLLATTVLVDWEAAGYAAAALVSIRVAGRPPRAVAEDLAKIGRVHSVSLTAGWSDVVALVLGVDAEDVRRTMTDSIRAVRGVQDANAEMLTQILYSQSGMATLPIAPWSPRDLPGPSIELDDLDHALLEQLIFDGHQSNRELARRLDVSDGTVRARIRRFEDAGFSRIVTVRDPVRSGDLASVAFAWLTTDGTSDTKLARQLLERPEVQLCGASLGAHDYVILVVAATENELGALLSDDLPALQGVAGVRSATVLESVMHRAHLIRFES